MDPVARARLSHSHSAWEFTASWAEARAVRGHVPSVWGDGPARRDPRRHGGWRASPPAWLCPPAAEPKENPEAKAQD